MLGIVAGTLSARAEYTGFDDFWFATARGGGLGVRLATGSAVVEEHHTPWHTTAVARPVYRHPHG